MGGSIYCTLSSEPVTSALAENGAQFQTIDRADYVLAAAPHTKAEDAVTLWKRRDDGDVVVGARRVGAGLRSWLYRRILNLDYRDYSSGLRLYRTSAVRRSGADITRPIDALIRLHRHGFKIKEIGVPARADGPTESVFSLFRLRALRNDARSADEDDRAYRRRDKSLRKRQLQIVSFLEVDVPLLDVGCGSSRLIQSIGKGIGLDIDLNKLRYLRERAPTVVAGSVKGLPFRDESFPQVVCSDVLNRMSDGAEHLAELGRVLRPGGTLVVGAPDAGAWFGARSENGYTEARMRNELEDAGFKVDEMRRVGRGEMIFRAVRRSPTSQAPAHQDR